MSKYAIMWLFLILNCVLVFLAINPWIDKWQGQAIAVLIFEVLFIIITGVPVLLYQMIKLKKTFMQSVRDAVDTVLDFLSGFA